MERNKDVNELFFPVELRPIFTESNGKRVEIPNNKVVVNASSQKPIGVVSKNYHLITNREAVELGKKICVKLLDVKTPNSIEIFNFNMPKTKSYCHVDLVHKEYVVNLWDENERIDIYIPYVRVTNSYNASRALRFDIGFCRKICLNGVIFEKETIRFKIFHLRNEFNEWSKDIELDIEKNHFYSLINKFKRHITSLIDCKISAEKAKSIIFLLFGINDKKEISKKHKDYIKLEELIEEKIKRYFSEIDENGYALFNVMTDIASHPLKNNRFLRRDTNSLQRLVGNWLTSIYKDLQSPDFSLDTHIESLKKHPKRPRHLTAPLFP